MPLRATWARRRVLCTNWKMAKCMKRTSCQTCSRNEVDGSNGLVILRGTVDSASQAEIIEDVASWHNGVKSVANEIRVLPPREAGSDTNLTGVLRDLIARDFPLERHTVQAQVTNGKAVLSGTVTSFWASKQIEKEVRRI